MRSYAPSVPRRGLRGAAPLLLSAAALVALPAAAAQAGDPNQITRTVPSQPLGPHTVVASFSDSDEFADSTSDPEQYTVAEPIAALSTDRLAFGDVLVATTSATQTVTLRNTGGLYLIVGNAPTFGPSAAGAAARREPTPIDGVELIGEDADDYAITDEDCKGAVLELDESCSVTVAFKPTQEGGSDAAAIEFVTNTDDSPLHVALTGTGVTERVDPEAREPERERERRELQRQMQTGVAAAARAVRDVLLERDDGDVHAGQVN